MSMIENDIRHFNGQFGFRPKLENALNLKVFNNIVLGGMGGSHLSADLVKIFVPGLNLIVHSDYGLPQVMPKGDVLFVASSYSGNTEETLDFFERVMAKKLPVAVVASGGKLLELAKLYSLPYVVLPGGLQPRMAIGYSFVALLEVLGEKEVLEEAHILERIMEPEALEKIGQDFAEKLHKKITLVYSSKDLFPLSYIWKIKLNENGKAPAFCNSLPELNHNEIVGFDNLPALKDLGDKFHVIILKDGSEHLRVSKRIELTRQLLEKRSVDVSVIELAGESKMEKVFNSVVLADWISFYVAKLNGADPERVNIIEDLKREMLN